MEHVILKRFGFKTDFFALMANSIATECAFLSDTTTSATTTFKVCLRKRLELNYQININKSFN